MLSPLLRADRVTLVLSLSWAALQRRTDSTSFSRSRQDHSRPRRAHTLIDNVEYTTIGLRSKGAKRNYVLVPTVHSHLIIIISTI